MKRAIKPPPREWAPVLLRAAERPRYRAHFGGGFGLYAPRFLVAPNVYIPGEPTFSERARQRTDRLSPRTI